MFFKLKLNERGVIKTPTLTSDPHLRMHTASTPAHIGILLHILHILRTSIKSCGGVFFLSITLSRKKLSCCTEYHRYSLFVLLVLKRLSLEYWKKYLKG